MVKRAAQTQDKFIIRLPDGMRDQIKAAADAGGRTMTAEIIARLQMTFDTRAELPHQSDEVQTLRAEVEGLRVGLRALEVEVSRLKQP